ncbi:hypothetical protein, partial [Desulfamplus magnetovallimortis]|uniref:hypothetical protein n=1 Tax=Desulfamplus magnetovallimortis TaxID=1246637 RepID=UPI001C984F2C
KTKHKKGESHPGCGQGCIESVQGKDFAVNGIYLIYGTCNVAKDASDKAPFKLFFHHETLSKLSDLLLTGCPVI